MNTQELKEKLYELQNTTRAVTYDGIYPADPRFIIDAETRVINIPESVDFLSAQYEHGAEKIYFEIDRYYKGKDLSIHTCVIQFINSTNEGFYVVSNMDLYSVPDKIVFAWTVENASTQFSGEILFSVRFYSINSDYCFTYNYNTLAAQSIILDTINVDNPTVGIIPPQDMQIWLDNLNNISNQAIQEMNRIKTAVEAISYQSEQLLEQSEQMNQDTQGLLDIAESKLDPSFGNAPPITSVAEGQEISVDDSADRNLVGMTLYGRSEQVKTTGAQLFDASRIANHEKGGATLTNNGDGSFTISGSGQLNEEFYRGYSIEHDEFIQTFKGGDIRINDAAYDKGINFQIEIHSTSLGNKYINSSGVVEDEYVQSNDTFARFVFYAPSGTTIQNYTIKPMIYQDGDGTWEPYTGGIPGPNPDYPMPIESAGDDGDVEVMLRGKNLLDYDEWKSIKGNGVTEIFENYGVVLKTGDTGDGYTQYATKYGALKIPVKYGKKYTLSWEYSGDFGLVYIFPNGSVNGSVNNNASAKKLSYTVSLEEIEFITFRTGVNNPNSTAIYKNIMISEDTEDLTFEPYKHQSIPLSIENGLNAIPVDTGGNYTDENGQQWIADTIELNSDGSGQLVQRVKKVVFDGSNDETWNLQSINEYDIANFHTSLSYNATNAFCTHFKKQQSIASVTKTEGYLLSNNTVLYLRVNKQRASTVTDFKKMLSENSVTVYYAVKKPITTPLSTSEISAFMALKTYKPNTIISNDANIGMKVEYIVDTKTYIDKNYVPKEKYDALESRIAALETIAMDDL